MEPSARNARPACACLRTQEFSPPAPLSPSCAGFEAASCARDLAHGIEPVTARPASYFHRACCMAAKSILARRLRWTAPKEWVCRLCICAASTQPFPLPPLLLLYGRAALPLLVLDALCAMSASRVRVRYPAKALPKPDRPATIVPLPMGRSRNQAFLAKVKRHFSIKPVEASVGCSFPSLRGIVFVRAAKLMLVPASVQCRRKSRFLLAACASKTNREAGKHVGEMSYHSHTISVPAFSRIGPNNRWRCCVVPVVAIVLSLSRIRLWAFALSRANPQSRRRIGRDQVAARQQRQLSRGSHHARFRVPDCPFLGHKFLVGRMACVQAEAVPARQLIVGRACHCCASILPSISACTICSLVVSVAAIPAFRRRYRSPSSIAVNWRAAFHGFVAAGAVQRRHSRPAKQMVAPAGAG